MCPPSADIIPPFWRFFSRTLLEVPLCVFGVLVLLSDGTTELVTVLHVVEGQAINKADDEVEAIAEEEDDGGEEKESVVEKDDKKEEDEESFCSFMTRTGSFSSKPSEL
jgi:hypothetical protein